LLPVYVKNGPAQATHGMIMILRRPIYPQAVTGITYPATQSGTDEHIERLVDCRERQGRIILAQRFIELLSRRMAAIVLKRRQNHHARPGCFESCPM
jgi:hypothetical protein